MTIEQQRFIDSPRRLTFSDWWDIVRRVSSRFGKDRLTLIAAGVAFYSFLALVPLIVALTSLYGMAAETRDILQHLEFLRDLLPPLAFDLIEGQVLEIVETVSPASGTTSVFSLVLATWMAKAGVNAMMSGLNVAYREAEDRGLVESLLISWALTIVLIVLVVVALVAVAVAPVIFQIFDWGWATETLGQIVRWLIAFSSILLAIGLLYRLGAARRSPSVPWLSVGSIAALIVWAVASVGLSIYISRLSDFQATYGALGAVVALMLWFWVNALAVLFGAKLNAEMEYQTACDTTVGHERPLGERGAFVADNVARVKDGSPTKAG